MSSLALFSLTTFLLSSYATASTSGIRRPSNDGIVELQQVEDGSDGLEASMFARLFVDDNAEVMEENEEDENDVVFQDMASYPFQGLRRMQTAEDTIQVAEDTIEAIGHNLAPMVDCILSRGLRASHAFNFGGALRRQYKLAGVDLTQYCNNAEASLDGDLGLDFRQLGGWDSVTKLTDWGTGSPRSRPRNGVVEWKVNYEFSTVFSEMYGLFNALFATVTTGCNGLYQLPEHETQGIKVVLDGSEFVILLFAKGTYKVEEDGSVSVVVHRAQIKSMKLVYSSREIESDQLEEEAPWILNTSFGRTMELWVKECITKWVLPALTNGMNRALEPRFPTTVDMSPGASPDDCP